ncbi:ABC-type multidrug transport system ATPase subunit [Flavobacterium sp. CG_9.1]|uniref:ATP-binding cassette domain-containing protein n=1 Tax=Flavobacterium sp. CG_9.1 TaxID=2787728 RepID=UPI001A303A4C|nr:ATP-binding cassette domain-containing protein [Flavobacterium sp. CG_9.1]MBG6060920.1 ABC-type multidrug transport system ATPase subunit [Flavobacterium sp. CG_9.1]
MDMTKSVLEVDSVQKQYDGKIIISDVYLKCETADIIGVLGRNGSGKSTLLKIIFGIVAADFKFVRVDGAVKSTTSDLLNEISYLPQENFIPNSFSVKKKILLSLAKDKIQDFCADEMIQSILAKKIKHLSGGELRYLEIKLILNNTSEFVLLDEPYNGLSPLMSDKVNDMITAMSLTKGIIITDHNYENVIKVSTRLALMKEGKLHHLKDKNELVEKGYLKAGMI